VFKGKILAALFYFLEIFRVYFREHTGVILDFQFREKEANHA